MSARDLLADLRAERGADPAAVAAFARGIADGRVSDAQAGAFAMAVCLGPGLGPAGRVALTEAMRDGGRILKWDAGAPVVDKHSTGGVGDPVSLILAPALAALGLRVPMVSGRGLGHTGGTLDKLEAIPGLRTELSEDAIRAAVASAGVAIVAATGDLAPADRRLYAIRDVTGTVDQVDLITASILSKKLAAGIGALVLDVKCGSGAFMPSQVEAVSLAEALVATAKGAGCRAAALMTAMDQPLAPACGNAVEVAAAMEVLDGGGGPLADVAVALGDAAVALAGGTGSVAEAIRSGGAAARFAAMVRAQGGPADFARDWRRFLPTAPVIRDVPAPAGGVIARVDAAALGRAVVALGGGRARDGDAVDPSVGLDRILRIGTRVAAGDPLARVHAADAAAADCAAAAVRRAMEIGSGAAPLPLILRRIPGVA